jgi:hypothetical protein
MSSLSHDTILEEAKIEARRMIERIYTASKARNLQIGRQIIELISKT